MPSLQLFKNHEVMNIASEMMRQEYALHELEGGEYDDPVTKKMARRIILSCMPHIMDFLHARVTVEASQAHLLVTSRVEAPSGVTSEPKGDEHLTEAVVDTDIRPIDGLHVQAKFKNVEFQPTIRHEQLEGYSGSLLVEEYDLFAVVRPQYIDPEPGEIVFGDEVMVPFREVNLFEASE